MSVSEIPRLFLLIVALKMVDLSNSLIGDYVCLRIENYTVTSYETYTEPVMVNSFTWCLQIPPRCPKTRTELRQRYRLKTEEKSRTVEHCCEGYKILATQDNVDAERCVPFCEKCLAGVCIAPNECQCKPGYRGDDCADECPPGSWGPQCSGTCDCGESGACDPANGTCWCPLGRLGPRCEVAVCAIGHWGPDCANECTCQNRDNDCDAVTGRCIVDEDGGDGGSSSGDDDNVSSQVEQTTSAVYLQSSTTERAQTSRINNVERTEVIAVPRETTERQTEGTTISATTSLTVPPQRVATNETRINDSSTTARPVIVLVSVPERRRDVGKDRPKYATKEAFFGQVQNDESVGVPKLDYVKTLHKDDIQTVTPIPMDIALIVVAAIVSLGLTSVAVVMILHMRSKLFETVRLAIYDEEKTKSPERESVNSGKMMPPVVNASLPPPPILTNSVYAANTEPETILTLDSIDSLNTYANGPAMIGLRISGNLRDLLQDGHYDRPPGTLIRLQTHFDHNTEHLYDEIPLQTSSLSNRKDT